jgi:hypothetical protein
MAWTTMQQNLTRWYQDHVSSDALPRPDTFSGLPCVDGNSSGENLWMSKSNPSFLSMDLSLVQNDEYFSSSQSASRTFTDASILASAKHDIQDHHNLEHSTRIKNRTRKQRGHFRHHNSPNRKWFPSSAWTRNSENVTERCIAEACAIIKHKIEIQKLKESQCQAVDAYDQAANDLSSQQRQFAH